MKENTKQNGAFLATFLLVTSVAFAKATNTPATADMKKDNSAVNVRDEKALTADEQAYGSEKDVEITRLIRKEIIAHKELSTYAHNVKIITVGGKVFLRGPVKSEEEKTQINAHATKIAGAQNVKNELEVVQK